MAQPGSYIHVNQKNKIMTKKEIKSAINKAVYMYAESLGYGISDDGMGGCVTFSKSDMKDAYDCIDYHRSEHNTIVVNWASDEIKADAKLIDTFAENQMRMYNA